MKTHNKPRPFGEIRDELISKLVNRQIKFFVFIKLMEAEISYLNGIASELYLETGAMLYRPGYLFTKHHETAYPKLVTALKQDLHKWESMTEEQIRSALERTLKLFIAELLIMNE